MQGRNIVVVVIDGNEVHVNVDTRNRDFSKLPRISRVDYTKLAACRGKEILAGSMSRG